MTPNVAAAALAAVFFVALAVGGTTFSLVVVVLSVLLLADLADVLARSGPRPITLAAAVPGIGLPAAIAARPDVGWDAVPDFVAGGVLAAFLALLVFGRRRHVVTTLGSTALVGLVVGLGAGGLLLLRSLPEGLRWVIGVVVVVAAVDAVRSYTAARAKPAPGGAATVAVALVGAGILVTGASPPFALANATGVAAVALLAVGAAGLLRDAIGQGQSHDSGMDLPPETRPRLAGDLASAAMPVLLAAPAAYSLARMAVL